MKHLALAVLLAIACTEQACADLPTPTKIPGDKAGPLSKAPVVRLAAFPSYLSPEKRAFQQGGDFDTKSYCSATIDIGADPGVQASIVILGVDNYLNTYETFPQGRSVTLTGNEKPGVDNVVRISFVIELRQNQTAFLINLIGDSIKAHKNFFVNMTPVACGASVN